MNKILLIIQREYLSRVRKKSFLLTTFLVPLLFIGMYAIIFYVALNNQEPTTQVQVIDDSGFIINELKDTDHLIFTKANGSTGTVKKDLEKGEKNTILLLIPPDVASSQVVELYDTEKKGIRTINDIENQLNDILKSKALKDAGIDTKILNSIKPAITVKSKELTVEGERDSSVGAAIGVSFGLSILIYLSLFLYGSQVMRGIIEEKSNRIVEVIISSVKPFQLMMGKIVGIGLVGVTQFVLWIVLSVGMLGVAGTVMMDKNISTEISETKHMSDTKDDYKTPSGSPINGLIKNIKTVDYPYVISSFLIYFIGGYLLYSALFAMVGSAVDSETETQQFMLPIIMPLLFTYMLSFSVLINNPHGSLAFWLSMIPFTSPIGMLVRIPFGVPTWQLILSIVLLVIGFVGTTYVAARVYRVGILMYGKKASYKELFKWFKYKG
ncbi:ABC transporter permease [Olivibacter domesticus]|uniref:ABC-2 type transport system permease protein n=1 Tax=Olivibacter domesticus TaxID=407022 RepID=A0A1H7PK21_OLID1|nr:ABC transporter permease [Olivibacter domesticus]SEL36123.1 ABC-2 type transport system permease protein [Olivibacter domesticus]